MIRLLQSRWMHIRKQYKSFLFWLLLPLFASAVYVAVDTNIEDQLRVPVGIVMEEETPLLQELTDELEELPLIEISYLSYGEAMYSLENHQLDSVFEFPAQYDEAILHNNRRGIVSHYTSNMSLAAIPVKESVVSFIQEQLNRSKAAIAVEDLFDTYQMTPPTTEDVAETSKEIQESERLIETTFSTAGKRGHSTETNSIISVLDVWILFVLFSTMMIFEWVVQERNHPAFGRISFTAYHPKKYILSQVFIYIGTFIVIDFVTFLVLVYGMDQTIPLSMLIACLLFRTTIGLSIFLGTLLFKQRFSYVLGALIVCIVLIGTSGMILPIEGITRHFPLFATLHPLQPIMHGEIGLTWLLISIGLCVIWLFKKENVHAKRS